MSRELQESARVAIRLVLNSPVDRPPQLLHILLTERLEDWHC